MLRREQHRRPVVRAEEPHAFFSDFGEFEQRHHLEAAGDVSYGARVDKERGITHPPLSAPVSKLFGDRVAYVELASTCEDVMWP